MKNYTSINDIDNINSWIKEAKLLKANPLKDIELGKNRTLGLLFFNSSLFATQSCHRALLIAVQYILMRSSTISLVIRVNMPATKQTDARSFIELVKCFNFANFRVIQIEYFATELFTIKWIRRQRIKLSRTPKR